MHEHHRDLVMALAEGSMSEADVTAAKSTIAGCAECAEELAKQRLALEFLRAAPDASLSELESRRLRHDLREQLGLAEAPAATGRRRRGFNWSRGLAIAGAAAVLVVVVAVAPRLVLLGGDDAADIAAIATTEAAAATTSASLDSGFSRLQTQDAGSPSAVAEAAPTTAAPADTVPAVGGGLEDLVRPEDFDVERYAYFATSPDLETLRATVLDEFAEVEATRNAITELAGDDRQLSWVDVNECAAAGVAELGTPAQLIALGSGRFEGAEAVFLAYAFRLPEETVVVAHDAATCAILGTAD